MKAMRRAMSWWWYAAGCALVVGLVAGRSVAGAGPMDVSGGPAEAIVFLRSAEPEAEGERLWGDSWMGRHAGGVLGVLRADEIKRLAGCLRGRVSARKNEPEPMVWARFRMERGGESRGGVIQRCWDGRLLFCPAEEGLPGQWFLLDSERFYGMLGGATSHFQGRFDQRPEGVALGRTMAMAFRDWGAMRIDRSTLTKRFFAGMDVPAAARLRPAECRYKVRLPSAIDPKFPSGLVVWVSPTDEGSPPGVLHGVADDLGLVLAGPDGCGNDRPVGDRLQLCVSTIADVMWRHHIDPRRVYVAGLSGGGKIATILQAGCPEMFGGCIPIVGTGWRRDEPIGGGQAWPRIVGQAAKGAAELLRSRRIAPVTGPGDFNYRSVLAFTEQMKEDGLAVRVFDVAGLGHAMPSEEVMGNAVRWIDEPWQAVRAAEVRRGKERMEEYLSTNKSAPSPEAGSGARLTTEAVAVLRRVVAEGPWTEEAWAAIEWLKAEGRAGVADRVPR